MMEFDKRVKPLTGIKVLHCFYGENAKFDIGCHGFFTK